MPVGNARGENISVRECQYNVDGHKCTRELSLLFGRPSGLISPNRTTFSGCNLSMKLRNLERLICPVGSSTTRTLAGATGESWSSILTTFGMRLAMWNFSSLCSWTAYWVVMRSISSQIKRSLYQRQKWWRVVLYEFSEVLVCWINGLSWGCTVESKTEPTPCHRGNPDKR